MASAGTVTVDFAAETAKFTAELKKVQTSLKSVQRDFTSLTQVATFAQRIFTGSIFANLARSAFQAADATADAAARAGIAVDTFSRLQFAAQMTDSDMGALTKAVKAFQVTMSNAAAGNRDANKTLGEFNLTVKQLQGLNIEQQLALVAEQFAKIRDPADRTRVAIELFGKSAGPELVPLLSQGKAGLEALFKEADRLGVTMSSETAAAIDQTDAAIKRLTASLTGYTTKFVAGLSVAILGPPEKALQLDDALAKLQPRIEQLRNWGADKMAPKNPLRQELEALLAESKKLSDEFWAEIDSGAKAAAALKKAETDALAAVAASPIEMIDLEPIRAMKIEVDELAEAYRKLDEEIIRIRQEREQDMLSQIDSDTKKSQGEIEKDITKQYEEEQAKRKEVEQNRTEWELANQKETTDAMKAVQQGFFQSGIDALQTFSGQSEKAAKALVLINKAQAIAQAIQNTAVAVTKAYAQGGFYGIAMAATMAALGAAQIALIVRSGYGQMQQIQRHGGAPIGTPANPVITQTAPGIEETAEGAQRVVQVIINGNLFNSQQTVDYLVDAIREEVNGKDVVLFSPVSRQAQEIRGA